MPLYNILYIEIRPLNSPYIAPYGRYLWAPWPMFLCNTLPSYMKKVQKKWKSQHTGTTVSIQRTSCRSIYKKNKNKYYIRLWKSFIGCVSAIKHYLMEQKLTFSIKDNNNKWRNLHFLGCCGEGKEVCFRIPVCLENHNAQQL